MKLPKQVKYRETNAKPDSKSDKRIFALMLQLCSRRTLTFFFTFQHTQNSVRSK